MRVHRVGDAVVYRGERHVVLARRELPEILKGMSEVEAAEWLRRRKAEYRDDVSSFHEVLILRNGKSEWVECREVECG